MNHAARPLANVGTANEAKAGKKRPDADGGIMSSDLRRAPGLFPARAHVATPRTRKRKRSRALLFLARTKLSNESSVISPADSPRPKKARSARDGVTPSRQSSSERGRAPAQGLPGHVTRLLRPPAAAKLPKSSPLTDGPVQRFLRFKRFSPMETSTRRKGRWRTCRRE